MDLFAFLSIFLIPFGFLTLFKGADFLVEGASAIAKRFNASNLVIGLTIVAFGTSLPELMINILANLRGATDLAVGNIIGSNITTILVVLGVCSLISPLAVSKETVFREIPLLFAAASILFLLGNDQLFNGNVQEMISRKDGIILVILFATFLYFTFTFNQSKEVIKKIGEEKIAKKKETLKMLSPEKSIVFIIVGCLTLPIGAQMVIHGALTVANLIGLSEHFIGLTIVALGTTTPEIFTSVVATLKKNYDIAIGNVVGSNLMNILLVLGVSSIMRPIPFEKTYNIDLAFYFIATILLFLFLAIKNHDERWWIFKIQREGHALSRTEGIVFLLLYVSFITFLLWRE